MFKAQKKNLILPFPDDLAKLPIRSRHLSGLGDNQNVRCLFLRGGGGGGYSITFYAESIFILIFPKMATHFLYLEQKLHLFLILQGQTKTIEFPVIATFC